MAPDLNRARTPVTSISAATLRRYETVRRIALTLPDVTEQEHFGRPSFRVGAKIFSTLWTHEGKAMVKLSGAEQADFCESMPETFQPVPGTWGMQGATFMQLAGSHAARTPTIRRALKCAWLGVARSRTRVK